MNKQLYPNMTYVRLVKYGDKVVDAVILYKNGGQYHICIPSSKVTFHATEDKLTKYIEKAKELDSPLNEALK